MNHVAHPFVLTKFLIKLNLVPYQKVGIQNPLIAWMFRYLIGIHIECSMLKFHIIFLLVRTYLIYCIAENAGGRKCWQIDGQSPNSPSILQNL